MRETHVGLPRQLRWARIAGLLLSLAILSASCSMVAQEPTPTPTDSPTATLPDTDTPTATDTATLLLTDTPTETPTDTASPTDTSTPTDTAAPTRPPDPTVAFTYDNWERTQAPDNILNQLANPLIAYINFNNREGTAGTPRPVNDTLILYYASPTAPNARIPIFEVTGETGDDIFISPSGDSIAYMRPGGGSLTAGLYIIDLQIGINGRVLPISSLVQRGIYSAPSWSPDGARLAIAVATGYDIDIFTVGRDGSNPMNMTRTGSYDFWPSFSPDGRYLLFVSDRLTCPSWIPAEPNTCDGTDTPPPFGGSIFVLDLASSQVTQVSNQFVTEPPRWLNARQIAFAVGDPTFGDPTRALWIADIVTGNAQQVRSQGAGDDAIKLSEAWASGGRTLLYQAATASSTEIVMMGVDGSVVGRRGDFVFPRYGMTAAWSPDGSRVAIGGSNGQCPYGPIVLDSNFNLIAQANPPPSMCDPAFSPDGRYLAFNGVNPRIDGRVDVYIANNNGFGAASMTGSLRGQTRFIGWVGGR